MPVGCGTADALPHARWITHRYRIHTRLPAYARLRTFVARTHFASPDSIPPVPVPFQFPDYPVGLAHVARSPQLTQFPRLPGSLVVPTRCLRCTGAGLDWLRGSSPPLLPPAVRAVALTLGYITGLRGLPRLVPATVRPDLPFADSCRSYAHGSDCRIGRTRDTHTLFWFTARPDYAAGCGLHHAARNCSWIAFAVRTLPRCRTVYRVTLHPTVARRLFVILPVDDAQFCLRSTHTVYADFVTFTHLRYRAFTVVARLAYETPCDAASYRGLLLRLYLRCWITPHRTLYTLPVAAHACRTVRAFATQFARYVPVLRFYAHLRTLPVPGCGLLPAVGLDLQIPPPLADYARLLHTDAVTHARCRYLDLRFHAAVAITYARFATQLRGLVLRFTPPGLDYSSPPQLPGCCTLARVTQLGLPYTRLPHARLVGTVLHRTLPPRFWLFITCSTLRDCSCARLVPAPGLRAAAYAIYTPGCARTLWFIRCGTHSAACCGYPTPPDVHANTHTVAGYGLPLRLYGSVYAPYAPHLDTVGHTPCPLRAGRLYTACHRSVLCLTVVGLLHYLPRNGLLHPDYGTPVHRGLFCYPTRLRVYDVTCRTLDFTRAATFGRCTRVLCSHVDSARSIYGDLLRVVTRGLQRGCAFDWVTPRLRQLPLYMDAHLPVAIAAVGDRTRGCPVPVYPGCTWTQTPSLFTLVHHVATRFGRYVTQYRDLRCCFAAWTLRFGCYTVAYTCRCCLWFVCCRFFTGHSLRVV